MRRSVRIPCSEACALVRVLRVGPDGLNICGQQVTQVTVFGGMGDGLQSRGLVIACIVIREIVKAKTEREREREEGGDDDDENGSNVHTGARPVFVEFRVEGDFAKQLPVCRRRDTQQRVAARCTHDVLPIARVVRAAEVLIVQRLKLVREV